MTVIRLLPGSHLFGVKRLFLDLATNNLCQTYFQIQPPIIFVKLCFQIQPPITCFNRVLPDPAIQAAHRPQRQLAAICTSLGESEHPKAAQEEEEKK